MAATKRDLTGRVEGVNENGIKIDGAWYNFSKFFEGDREPARGAAVSCVIGSGTGGKEFLNKLAVVGSALPNGGGNSPVSSGASYGRSPDTDKRIARQVALKASVDFHAASEGSTSDVIATARIFEAFLAESYTEANVEDAA